MKKSLTLGAKLSNWDAARFACDALAACFSVLAAAMIFIGSESGLLVVDWRDALGFVVCMFGFVWSVGSLSTGRGARDPASLVCALGVVALAPLVSEVGERHAMSFGVSMAGDNMGAMHGIAMMLCGLVTVGMARYGNRAVRAFTMLAAPTAYGVFVLAMLAVPRGPVFADFASWAWFAFAVTAGTAVAALIGLQIVVGVVLLTTFAGRLFSRWPSFSDTIVEVHQGFAATMAMGRSSGEPDEFDASAPLSYTKPVLVGWVGDRWAVMGDPLDSAYNAAELRDTYPANQLENLVIILPGRSMPAPRTGQAVAA
jgi:hypothetical protein